jgi:hypothetical protein
MVSKPSWCFHHPSSSAAAPGLERWGQQQRDLYIRCSFEESLILVAWSLHSRTFLETGGLVALAAEGRQVGVSQLAHFASPRP